MSKQIVGGGTKKVLYTLRTVQRMGVRKATKALTAKNACKACGYGMGGQMGGMTNEQGEFPSVCNKSVQAQSTDTQPPIPDEVFAHDMAEFRELSPHELEHLGRLNTPIYKPAGGDQYKPITWDDALDLAAKRLGETTPARSFFYSSGRSSNEAGFLFQLLARAWGTNNVSNCSYYCHQATGVGLGTTIGTGTATVELADLDACDLIFVIGANPASNHPRFIHKLKTCRDRGGEVIVINPAKEPGLVKFAVPKSARSMLAGGSEIASDYLQPRIGSDVALFVGIAKALISGGHVDESFIRDHTEGYEALAAQCDAISWTEITAHTGLTQVEIERVAGRYAKSRNAVFAWGMGMTHHVHGSENVEYIANLALLRGMIGRPGAGLLPLRGHSNVQGIGTIGVKPVLPEAVMRKMETELGLTFPEAKGLDTMAAMQAAHDGEIDAAILMGGNLYAANPNAKWAEAALDKIGFRLCLTTSLNRSHFIGVEGDVLILPVTARDEERQPTTQESMFSFVRLSDGGIDRLSNVRPETDILADLALRLMPDSAIDFAAFKSHENLRQAIAATVPGMDKLASIGVAKTEFHIAGRILHEPSFNTPTGKASFQVRDLPKPAETPFMLTTMRSEGQFNSIIYEESDSYRGTKTRWSVLVSKDDLAELGLAPGDKANLISDHGRMDAVTVYPFDLPRGNLMAYYPEANALTGTEVDPRSKTPAFKSTPVRLERA